MNRIDTEVRDLQKAKDQFFNNDLELLCYLTDDRAERYKTARFVLGKSGVSVGKDKAKAWLSEQDNNIKTELKADKIRING